MWLSFFHVYILLFLAGCFCYSYSFFFSVLGIEQWSTTKLPSQSAGFFETVFNLYQFSVPPGITSCGFIFIFYSDSTFHGLTLGPLDLCFLPPSLQWIKSGEGLLWIYLNKAHWSPDLKELRAEDAAKPTGNQKYLVSLQKIGEFLGKTQPGVLNGAPTPNSRHWT
jgi:hypothetical protein